MGLTTYGHFCHLDGNLTNDDCRYHAPSGTLPSRPVLRKLPRHLGHGYLFPVTLRALHFSLEEAVSLQSVHEL